MIYNRYQDVQAAAFEEGNLRDIVHSVRKVTIGDVADMPLSSVLVLLQSSCRALRFLPNVNDLKIFLTATSEAQAVVFLSVFRAISEYPCYDNLRSLILVFNTSPQYKGFQQPLSQLMVHQEFMGGGSAKCPPNVEYLSISGMANPYFDFSVKAMPYPCILFYPTTKTLKNVKIEANLMNSVVGYIEPMKYITLATYPSVTEVWFVQDTQTCNFHAAYEEICKIFPNTQDLRVDYGTSAYRIPSSAASDTYRGLAKLSKLRRALVPWLLNGVDSPVDPSRLGEDLRFWLTGASVPRFTLLEYIDFASQNCYFKGGRVCRIKPTRPQPIGVLRQQRFHTQGDIGF
ncbi:uncharacterized protein DFL_001364 [Arthrobotrys flagrans]|uniref:Uncharacterized protein n=1 Tax=Arthrobotrys flagrans TaxID=97331 RepID=A0A437AH53_ARTFL|nr:hypothetical protein DFL_001364 [Arthrobotrys flagrans]